MVELLLGLIVQSRVVVTMLLKQERVLIHPLRMVVTIAVVRVFHKIVEEVHAQVPFFWKIFVCSAKDFRKSHFAKSLEKKNAILLQIFTGTKSATCTPPQYGGAACGSTTQACTKSACPSTFFFSVHQKKNLFLKRFSSSICFFQTRFSITKQSLSVKNKFRKRENTIIFLTVWFCQNASRN